MKHLIQFQTLLRQFVVLVVFNSIALVSFAQNENSAKEYEIIATDNGKQPIFIRFSKTKIKADDKSIFEFLANQYKLDENTTFVEKEGSAKEQNGIFSKKLFQYYHGIKVEFGQLIITHKDGYLRTINGHITPTKNLNLQPSISEKEALEFALKQINAKEYAWQNEGFENLLRTEEENPKATYYPKAELVIIDKGLFEEKPDVRLAYKFDIYATYPISRQDYYVDAHTGEQVFQNTTLMHASGDTRYSGRREFVTRAYNSMFRLRDYTRGLGIETYNMNDGSDFQAATDFTDRDNNWTAAEYDNAAKDNAALDAHWGAEKTYDYFLKVHNRNSWDNNGGKIKNYVHTNLIGFGYGNNINAFADTRRNILVYGDGSSSNFIDPLTTIDIVAHEIGHLICARTASLIYQKEQGAINESLSDIWGAMVEYYTDPNKDTYSIAEDCHVGSSGCITNCRINRVKTLSHL